MDVFSKGGDDFWAYHDISIRSMYAEFCAKLTTKTEMNYQTSIGNYQFGFSPNGSSIDFLFTLKYFIDICGKNFHLRRIYPSNCRI